MYGAFFFHGNNIAVRMTREVSPKLPLFCPLFLTCHRNIDRMHGNGRPGLKEQVLFWYSTPWTNDWCFTRIAYHSHNLAGEGGYRKKNAK